MNKNSFKSTLALIYFFIVGSMFFFFCFIVFLLFLSSCRLSLFRINQFLKSDDIELILSSIASIKPVDKNLVLIVYASSEGSDELAQMQVKSIAECSSKLPFVIKTFVSTILSVRLGQV